MRWGKERNHRIDYKRSDKRCKNCDGPLFVKDRNGTTPAKPKDSKIWFYYERIYRCVNKACKTDLVMFPEDQKLYADYRPVKGRE